MFDDYNMEKSSLYILHSLPVRGLPEALFRPLTIIKSDPDTGLDYSSKEDDNKISGVRM